MLGKLFFHQEREKLVKENKEYEFYTNDKYRKKKKEKVSKKNERFC
jgi:hypothetical protein